MEQEVARGWCTKCTCHPRYHVGATICINCGCTGFELDVYRENLDKRNLEMRKQYEDWGEAFEIDETQAGSEVFMGTASRECSSCGDVKLYKEFGDSNDPNIICNYCLWDQALESESEETEFLIEEDIIENERASEDEQERQSMIDAFLLGLDE